jgi:uncharacterized membrane protein YdjX (TVP38/TMEM64 family)
VTLPTFLRRFGLILILAALLSGAVASGAWRWLSLSALQAHHAQLRHLVAASPLISAAAFVAAFVLVVAACLPGPGLMMTVGGYLFGPVVGGALSLVACIAGSTLAFLACRSAFADLIARAGGPRVRELEQALDRNAFSYLLSLKLLPIAPMFVGNVAAGMAGVRLSALIAATALGSAPVCFILAGLGAGLSGLLDHGGVLNPRLFARPDVIGPLLALSLLSLASVAWRALRRRS